jgi:hypothetical protein
VTQTYNFECGDKKYKVIVCSSRPPQWQCEENGAARLVLYDGWAIFEGLDPLIAAPQVVVNGIDSHDERAATAPAGREREPKRILVACLRKGKTLVLCEKHRVFVTDLGSKEDKKRGENPIDLPPGTPIVLQHGSLGSPNQRSYPGMPELSLENPQGQRIKDWLDDVPDPK